LVQKYSSRISGRAAVRSLGIEQARSRPASHEGLSAAAMLVIACGLPAFEMRRRAPELA